jgi:cell division protein FtsQ
MPKAPEKKRRYRLWMGAGLCLLAFASTAWGTKSVRNFLTTDARFYLRHPQLGFRNEGVVVIGASYTSPGTVQQVFLQDYGRSIYDINIAERRRRLLAIDWIEDASVARVWPNRIYVRVRERKPVAFVNVPHQAFLLVDAEGVLLSPPPRANFEFPVLSGVWIDQSEADRKVRVQAALRLLDELGADAKDISEVNASTPDDLRVTTEVQGKAVELWLGDSNFAQRYRNFAEHAAALREGSPRASVFDLRIDDRITAR